MQRRKTERKRDEAERKNNKREATDYSKACTSDGSRPSEGFLLTTHKGMALRAVSNETEGRVAMKHTKRGSLSCRLKCKRQTERSTERKETTEKETNSRKREIDLGKQVRHIAAPLSSRKQIRKQHKHEG